MLCLDLVNIERAFPTRISSNYYIYIHCTFAYNGVKTTHTKMSKTHYLAFDFRSSTTDTSVQVIIGDFNNHGTEWGYRSTNDDGTLVERWCDAKS